MESIWNKLIECTLPLDFEPVMRFVSSTLTQRMQWERDERSFIMVDAVTLFSWATLEIW